MKTGIQRAGVPAETLDGVLEALGHRLYRQDDNNDGQDDQNEKEDYASVCCAIQNFSLYVSEAGLASKWATGPVTRDSRFYDLLNIDEEREFIVALIWYGYPKITPTQHRKDVKEIVTETD